MCQILAFFKWEQNTKIEDQFLLHLKLITDLVIHNSVFICVGEDDRMYVDGNGQLRERKLGYDELYPGHIPTSTLQKVLLSIGSAGMSLLDPSRDGKFIKFAMITTVVFSPALVERGKKLSKELM